MTDCPPLVIFDLDGTLLDPAGSITGGIASALAANGIAVPSDDVLRGMVGPPLVESLATLGVSEAARPGVVDAYRRSYLAHGMAQARPYPGIPELLDTLLAEGYRLAVATYKPQRLAERLLDLHGLADRFSTIHGSPDDESLPPAAEGKAGIVAEALRAASASAEVSRPADARAVRAVMVGDRRHDAHGAAANSLGCIGVAWGFAEPGELEALGLIDIVEDSTRLATAIRTALAPVGASRLVPEPTAPQDAVQAVVRNVEARAW